MMLLLRESDEHRGEHRKHECLYEGNKQLQKIHEHSKEHRYSGHSAAYVAIHRHCYEDDTHKGQ